MREFARVHMLGALIKLVDGAGNGAGDGNADYDRTDLDDQKQPGYDRRRDEHALPPFEPISEDRAQHRSGTRSYPKHRGPSIEDDRRKIADLDIQDIQRRRNA